MILFQKREESKGATPFLQIITKFLSVNTLHTVSPWVASLAPNEVKGQANGHTEGQPVFSYIPPLPR